MKRTLFCFVCALLLALILALPAAADEKGRVTLSGETEKLSRGDLFAASLDLNRNPGVNSLRVTLRFDGAVLQTESVEDLGLLPGFAETSEEGALILRWKAPEGTAELTAAGKLARIVFRVKEDAYLAPTTIETVIDHRFFDAQDSRGNAVAFDTQSLSVPLACYHVHDALEVLEEPAWDKAGKGKRVCLDCGKEWEETLYPTLTSTDGKTVGSVPPGQYDDGDKKGVRTDYLYGGADAELARKLFGGDLIRSFRVTFTKNENVFVPKGEVKIRLTTEFYLPDAFVLYVLKDGTGERVEAQLVDGELRFAYSAGTFVLVSRETALPSATTATPAPPETSFVPVTSLSAEEEAKRHEIAYLALGVAAVVLFGAGALFILRRGKRF